MEAMKLSPVKNWFKKISHILLALLLVSAIPLNANADVDIVELNELVNNSSLYDGETLRIRGEVLLEALERKDYVWVNINDGTNAMGVVMPYEAVSKISQYGNYKQKGDIIEIEGVFHRSCTAHGGDMDLHFVKMLSVTKGEPIKHEIGYQRFVIGILAIIAAAFSIWGIKPSNSKQ